MLQHVPAWLGAWLHDVRAGHAGLVIAQLDAVPAPLDLRSPAFANGAPLPQRYTADGAGVSPPLEWDGVPADARSLALIVEDPDAPAAHPLTHAIVWNLPPTQQRLDEGAIADGALASGAGSIGRNSYLRHGWLPPDPPTGHGAHDYVFQLFALSATPEIGDDVGRSAFLRAIAGHVLAAGLLTASYARGAVATPA